MGMEFDFSGYATRNDLLCADGRTIRKDAFKECDGMTVPLIWNHDHSSPDAVLGHALLENRDDGVYAYCKFNETANGKNSKQLVENGDVRSLSIWANKLKQVGGDVIHGKIRELSLVLAGANPGAYVDFIMAHDDMSEDELVANYDENALIIYHSATNDDKKGDTDVAEDTKKEVAKEENSEKTVADVFNTLNEEQKTVVYAMIGQALEEAESKKAEPEQKEEVKHSEEDSTEDVLEHSDGEKTVADVFNTLNEEQKTVVYAMIGQALEDAGVNIEGGANEMKHNVFDQEEVYTGEVLSHSDMVAIIDDAKRNGSLKEAVLAHGIEDLDDILFPDHKTLTNTPEFIKRDDDWVARVLGGVHHSPFSRIKTVFADITAAQARAKGYQKGNLKIEEVFKLLKRTTNPTTIYKKQKLDRDDVLDINDFNILPWLKQEIRMMLNEELARAILVGDGRDPVEEANDKIDEECIRPIWKMEELFTVKVEVPVAAGATDTDRAKAFIKACKKSRKNYKGSGNPSMFMPEDMLTDCLLIEDLNGRLIYETVQQLAAALRVKEIIPVPVMDALTRKDDDDKVFTLGGIYVNLADYNVGTDKGGEINFFDDFDIDYNQMKYLMETRCSGTLVKPYSAVAIEFTEEAAG